MELNADGLQLKLTPYEQVDCDDEDWANTTVTIQCNGFSGSFVAWIQTGDIRRFQEELTFMYKSVGTAGMARLCGAEPDIDVKLTMDRRGHIVGSYRFESERRDGTPTVLSGKFEMDQSYIPTLTKGLDDLALTLRSSRD
jgi:hypothetical protein